MTIVENINQIILLLIFLVLFRLFIKHFLRSLTLKTKTELDEKIIDSIANPLWILIAIIVLDYIVSLFYPSIWVKQVFRTRDYSQDLSFIHCSIDGLSVWLIFLDPLFKVRD